MIVPVITPDSITLQVYEAVGGPADGESVACLTMEVDRELLLAQLGHCEESDVATISIPLSDDLATKLLRAILNLQAMWANDPDSPHHR